MKERFPYIDNMKAIAIILMVLGHTRTINTDINMWFFSFRMPLLFFLSGFLISESKLLHSSTSFFQLKAKSIISPYVFFFFLSYFFFLATHQFRAHPEFYTGIKWYEPLQGLILAHGNALYVNESLWFLPCLFVATQIHFLTRKRMPKMPTACVLLLVGLIASSLIRGPVQRLPWSVENALVATAFYAIGHQSRDYLPKIAAFFAQKKFYFMILLVASFILSIATVAINGPVDLCHLIFGRYPLLYIPSGLIGIFFIFCFSLLITPTAELKWLARNSMIPYALHFFFFAAFDGIGAFIFKLPVGFQHTSVLWGLLWTLLALMASYPASLALYKFFPFVFPVQRSPIQPTKLQFGNQSIIARYLSMAVSRHSKKTLPVPTYNAATAPASRAA